MRRRFLCGLLAAIGFVALAGCGGDSSTTESSNVSKDEIDKAMQKMKKMGPNAHK